MRFTHNALKRLAEPDSGTVTYEMTAERKEKWAHIALETINFLRDRTNGPVEAYAVLQQIQHCMEDAYGIRGGIVVENDDDDHERPYSVGEKS